MESQQANNNRNNIHMRFLKHCILSSILAGVFIPASTEEFSSNVTSIETGKITAPMAKSPLTAPIPYNLKHLLIDNPYVDFTLLINEAGEVVDSIPIESNHYKLLPAAQAVIDSTTFTAAIRDGEPILIRFQFRVIFQDLDQELWRSMGQLPMGSNAMEGAERRIYQLSKNEFTYTRTEVTDLDQPLKISEGSLVVIEDDQGNAPNGSCTIEYYVDAHGIVRLPKVLKSDNEPVSLSALGSLKKLRFSPPTRGNTPTYVKVRQRFKYGDN